MSTQEVAEITIPQQEQPPVIPEGREVNADGYYGREVSSLPLAAVSETPHVETYVTTSSGNEYALMNGRHFGAGEDSLVMVNRKLSLERRAQGLGLDVMVLTPQDVKGGLLRAGEPFYFSYGNTSRVTSITAIDASTKYLDGSYLGKLPKTQAKQKFWENLTQEESRYSDDLSLQENILAAAMHHRDSRAAVNFDIGKDGTRYNDTEHLSNQEFKDLIANYANNPKEVNAWARNAILEINRDKRLSESERHDRISRYLDAYFDLTIKLDHAAFPAEAKTTVHEGVPDYLPDGFVDMGGDSETTSAFRSREQIVVDKRQMLEKYKPLFMDLFTADYQTMTNTEIKQYMTNRLASAVYFSVNYDHKLADTNGGYNDGGKVRLSELDEGVCRHQGLLFQVFLQTAGVQSRLLKAYMDGVRHATNLVRIDSKWYVYDATNPDYANKNGQKQWRPGAFQVDGPPPRNGTKKYEGTLKHSKQPRNYVAHDDMFWHIDRTAA